MSAKTFSLDELCLLADYSKRTVRYYIQLGLVSRPVGEARAARYTGEHLSQLLQVKKLSADGVSLERIREILAGGHSPVPPRERRPGTVEVRSHIHVAPGIEVQITPEEAGMSPEQVREFVREIMKLDDSILRGKAGSGD
mgnify:CR=1 FL=1